jgi:phosphohistidine swiveling domain-containing protein
MSQSVINEHQPSLTEWFAVIGEGKESEDFRKEDNGKTGRLEFLYQQIGLPYERPEKFEASDLNEESLVFQHILDERGDELCAIRLIPKFEGLPKLRMRGLSIRNCYETWFKKQEINPADYYAYICPHTDKLIWSTIFVVKEDAIFGEVVRGMHAQLTHGDTTHHVYRFVYNYKDFSWEKHDSKAETVLKQTLDLIKVVDESKIQAIKQELKANFHHQYLSGYFETTVWPSDKITFIDYNRLLPKYIATPQMYISSLDNALRGAIAQPGIATGVARIVFDPSDTVDFHEGDILVSPNTDIRFISLMKKASAIVTENGGTLSHASIVARELGKPCLVGVLDATTKISNGQQITVDAFKGVLNV